MITLKCHFEFFNKRLEVKKKLRKMKNYFKHTIVLAVLSYLVSVDNGNWLFISLNFLVRVASKLHGEFNEAGKRKTSLANYSVKFNDFAEQ